MELKYGNIEIAGTHEHQGSTAGHSVSGNVFMPKDSTLRFYKDYWTSQPSTSWLHVIGVEHIEEITSIN